MDDFTANLVRALVLLGFIAVGAVLVRHITDVLQVVAGSRSPAQFAADPSR